MARNKQMVVKWSDEEHACLSEVSATLGIAMSDLIRKALRAEHDFNNVASNLGHKMDQLFKPSPQHNRGQYANRQTQQHVEP